MSSNSNWLLFFVILFLLLTIPNDWATFCQLVVLLFLILNKYEKNNNKYPPFVSPYLCIWAVPRFYFCVPFACLLLFVLICLWSYFFYYFLFKGAIRKRPKDGFWFGLFWASEKKILFQVIVQRKFSQNNHRLSLINQLLSRYIFKDRAFNFL